MAMSSAYKSNHSNQFRLDPVSVKNTKLSDLVADLYGTWEAIPPEVRYKLTGSERALREAVASGAMHPDGSVNDGEYGAYTSWKESNPDGTYNDFKKAKEAEDLIKMNNRALAAKGEYKPEGAAEEKPSEEAPADSEREDYIAQQSANAAEEGGATSRELYDWEKPEGLAEHDSSYDFYLPTEDSVFQVEDKYKFDAGSGESSPYANVGMYSDYNDWDEYKKEHSHR